MPPCPLRSLWFDIPLPNSPYASIARIATLELNLCSGVARRRHRIETQKFIAQDPNSDLLNYNPTGKVPTLATDDDLSY
ncbi:glutathione S-transferase N-terminal domain-containing protein [Nostoc sp.]|uniref:glutathione S-transferase N-terminal domain-containing protein n=1 Tax=Nostoc sp. TaxID=1180 RepID=UPI002FF4F4A6